MEKKEVMVMNLNQKVEEIQGAPRATGVAEDTAKGGDVFGLAVMF